MQKKKHYSIVAMFILYKHPKIEFITIQTCRQFFDCLHVRYRHRQLSTRMGSQATLNFSMVNKQLFERHPLGICHSHGEQWKGP